MACITEKQLKRNVLLTTSSMGHDVNKVGKHGLLLLDSGSYRIVFVLELVTLIPWEQNRSFGSFGIC